MNQLRIEAINPRNGTALTGRVGGPDEPEKVLSSEAEQLIDALFRQLKTIFAAAVSTNFRNEGDEKTAKQQWVLAFAENGIKTRHQLAVGIRHARASDSPFWPSPGQFITWCKDCTIVLGITLQDVMAEFYRYNEEKDKHLGGAERFPWSSPIMYWLVCDLRRAMYQYQLNEAEVEKCARRQLGVWAKKVAEGHRIPDPLACLMAKAETLPACQPRLNDGKDDKMRYMPNAALLGAVTPAQWLHNEYLRRQAIRIADQKLTS